MKKIAVIIILFLASFAAFGQTGNLKVTQFPSATLPLSGTELIPIIQNGNNRQTPASTFLNGSGGNPGGSPGQSQYNINGTSFGGYTMSGDCTLVTTTGVITCSTIDGISPFDLGSVTTSSPRISGDVTSGFYTANPGAVDVQVGGSQAMEWTSTGVTVPSLPAYSLTGTITGGGLINVFVGTNLTLTTTGGVTTLNAGGVGPGELDIIEENGPNIIEENGPNIVEENSP